MVVYATIAPKKQAKEMENLLANLKQVVCNDTSLRYYQFENKQKIYNEWQEYKSVMLQMPTGTGKTRLFVSIVKDILSCRMHDGIIPRVLLMVHRKELGSQIADTLASYGLEYGIIQSKMPEVPSCHIQVASVQSLVRRIKRWGRFGFDFIIVDEAHHTPSPTYLKILGAFPDSKLLGVTATPHRLDYWGFAHIFDKLIESPAPMEFIKSGFLSNYDYYSVAPDYELLGQIEEIPLEKGDFAEDYLLDLLDTIAIRAQIVDSYMKYGNGKKAIVYTINKAHNIHLCEEYRKRGIRAATIDCDTPSDERKFLLDAFKKGDIQIICNVNILSEGFDCPDVEVIQLTRPTYSLSMYLQQVGRGLRASPGKSKAIFIDNVGSYLRLGLPSDHRSWEEYFNRKPMKIKPRTVEPSISVNLPDGDIDEGNDEMSLVYSTAPEEEAVEKAIETSNTPKTVNKKLDPILLLASYL